MEPRCAVRLIVRMLVILGLLTPQISWAQHTSRPPAPGLGAVPQSGDMPRNDTGLLFRTRVTLSGSRDMKRLQSLGVTVLGEMGSKVLLLVDADQLETLARLRFQPEQTNELRTLIAAHAEAKPWLAASLQPLLAQAGAA